MRKFLTTIGLTLIMVSCFGQEIKQANVNVLNVRSGAGTDYEIIYKLSKGEEVKELSIQGDWSEIELSNGEIGYVSTKFLTAQNSTNQSYSDNQDKSNHKEKKKVHWFNVLIALVILGYVGLKAKDFLSGLFGGSTPMASLPKKISTPKQSIRDPLRNSAVFKFRIKGTGSAGCFNYVDGMNVEVAVKGRSATSPFNSTVEALFVQEIARKYNVEPKGYSGIKMIFNKQDRLDVELM